MGSEKLKHKFIVREVPITLREVYMGCKKRIEIPLQSDCKKCERGCAEIDICQACDGSGRSTTNASTHVACRVCAGRGGTCARQCMFCNGTGRSEEDQSVVLEVFKGVPDKTIVSNAQSTVSFRVSILPNKAFVREGNDLKCSLRISMFESLCGFIRYFEHLDGRCLHIVSKKNVVYRSGTIIRVHGEGMPVYENPMSYGNLHIVIEVDFSHECPVHLHRLVEKSRRNNTKASVLSSRKSECENKVHHTILDSDSGSDVELAQEVHSSNGRNKGSGGASKKPGKTNAECVLQ